MSVRRLCEEEATEEEKAEAAGAELKTKTPHNDVGNYPPPVHWSTGLGDLPILEFHTPAYRM